MRVTCIHQPAFLPWLGFVESMLVCDPFILYDDVQYEDGGYQNRNRIKTAQGTQWLTVPVQKSFGQMVSEIRIADQYSARKLLASLRVNYQRTPHFGAVFPVLEATLARQYTFLMDLDVAVLEAIKGLIAAPCSFVFSSTLKVAWTSRTERLIALCEAVKAEVIYAGSGTREYVDEASFAQRNLRVVWHAFENRHPVYRQTFPNLGFVGCLSVVDMLFNLGPEETRVRLLQSGTERLAAGLAGHSP